MIKEESNKRRNGLNRVQQIAYDQRESYRIFKQSVYVYVHVVSQKAHEPFDVDTSNLHQL